MKHLSIDLETYSSIDIKTAGLYKYMSSPDFEILLFAYSLNGKEPEVIDLTQGEEIPAEVLGLLTDDDCIKHAYNAAFEWRALSIYMCQRLPIHQWRDTMLQARYAGYPGSLEGAGAALGLEEDKAKMTVGKSLIRLFCKPCKPTSKNGGRTRNLPEHEPEKWAIFKEYNRQDVTAEMEIANRLGDIQVPDEVQKQWETDMRINAYGVAADMELVHGALRIADKLNADLMDEARRISGLENPNSVSQLTDWVNKRTNKGIDNMRKATVAQLLEGESLEPDVRRLLEIRQQLGKTSTKKYDAIEEAVCPDGRIRGLLQFYGANRTGRWAGRLVQVQNLPRTYTEPLDLAKDIIKNEEVESLRCIFGSPNDTLSQMIRTAFIATPGNVLIDADFSAIEARVISWLACEEWKLDVFRTHGKIYEATAAQMFNIPFDAIKKGQPEYKYRQYGKIAELALGYQGGVGAMRQMDATGALEDLTDDEVNEMVSMWRNKNSRITRLWWECNEKVIDVIENGGSQKINLKIYDRARAEENEDRMNSYQRFSPYFNLSRPNGELVAITFKRETSRRSGHTYLTIELPSQRKLFYTNPRIGENRWGSKSITYMGVDQTKKKWCEQETYGGKLVENIVQAIARDCLAYAIENLEKAGFKTVFHIHDEVVIDSPKFNTEEKMLEKVVQIMTLKPGWAAGLPLNADGWVGKYFKKD